jgi:hypothetical protein
LKIRQYNVANNKLGIITAITEKEETVLPSKSVEKPIKNIRNILIRFDRTISAPPVIVLFLSAIFSKKYPGKKLVKSNDARPLNQFCNGTSIQFMIDPS